MLRQVFVVHGLPEVLVSDNGAAFTNADFQTFVERNSFRHIRSVPTTQHGLAECMSSANYEKCLTYDNSGFPIGGMALVSNQERQNENHDAHTRLRSF